MHTWAENFGTFDRGEQEDIEAEMSLRKVEPPFDQTKEALEKILRRSKKSDADPLNHAVEQKN